MPFKQTDAVVVPDTSSATPRPRKRSKSVSAPKVKKEVDKVKKPDTVEVKQADPVEANVEPPKLERSAAEPAPKKKRKVTPNRWIQHVKQWRLDNPELVKTLKVTEIVQEARKTYKPANSKKQD